MKIERKSLPGIGVRHTFATAQGRRVGIVEYHGGDRREVVHDDPDDPDRMVSLTLTRTEAIALATLLASPELAALLASPELAAGTA